MKEFIEISCCPFDEDQISDIRDADYRVKGRKECKAFLNQILRHYPPPIGGGLRIKLNPHDFGSYYEVVADYDDEKPESEAWAYSIERDEKDALKTWDEQAKEELRKEGLISEGKEINNLISEDDAISGSEPKFPFIIVINSTTDDEDVSDIPPEYREGVGGSCALGKLIENEDQLRDEAIGFDEMTGEEIESSADTIRELLEEIANGDEYFVVSRENWNKRTIEGLRRMYDEEHIETLLQTAEDAGWPKVEDLSEDRKFIDQEINQIVTEMIYDLLETIERGGEKFSGYNKPKRTPNHPSKSHAVLAKDGSKVKLIRFGQKGVSGAGKNPKTPKEKKRRKSFKARHAKNIKKGKMSAAYWANRVKWE